MRAARRADNAARHAQVLTFLETFVSSDRSSIYDADAADTHADADADGYSDANACDDGDNDDDAVTLESVILESHTHRSVPISLGRSFLIQARAAVKFQSTVSIIHFDPSDSISEGNGGEVKVALLKFPKTCFNLRRTATSRRAGGRRCSRGRGSWTAAGRRTRVPLSQGAQSHQMLVCQSIMFIVDSLSVK